MVESFYDDVIFREVEASMVRRREEFAPGQWRLYGVGTYTAPGGTRYEFRQYPKAKWIDGKRIEVMEFKPTQMRNYPIQGESGFFVQVIAGALVRWLLSRNFFDGRALIINTVHDSYYFDVHKSVLVEFAAGLKAIMESIPTTMRRLGYDLKVPFPAEVEAGPSMNQKSKVQLEVTQ